MSIRVAIDVDDVLFPLVDEWCRRYNQTTGESLTPVDIVDWDIRKFMTKMANPYALLTPDLYDAGLPIPGALSGVLWMRDRGYDVVFVSACGAGMASPKMQWLRRWGFLAEGRWVGGWHQDFIACQRKELIRADIIVDDSAETVRRCIEHGMHAVLFTTPHNATSNDATDALQRTLHTLPEAWDGLYRSSNWGLICSWIGKRFGR